MNNAKVRETLWQFSIYQRDMTNGNNGIVIVNLSVPWHSTNAKNNFELSIQIIIYKVGIDVIFCVLTTYFRVLWYIKLIITAARRVI